MATSDITPRQSSSDEPPPSTSLTDGLPRIRRDSESTAKQVARELMRHLIRSNQLSAGDRLPSERELASAFGVGRAAVREALKSLDILGVVDIRPGSGTFLVPPDSEFLPKMLELGLLLGEKTVTEVVETRALLEVAIARLAAERRDEDDLTDLEQIVRSMATEVDNPDAFADLDIAFHLRLAKSTKNRTLSSMLSSVQSLLRIWIVRVTTTQQGDFAQLHSSVFEAVKRGDASEAERAMRAHMDDARQRLEATLPSSAEGTSKTS